MQSNAMEEIAAAIAHEIKNPLTMLKANIDIIESAGSNEKFDKNYAIIHKELKKINDIMIDFINLTRKPSQIMDIVYVADIVEDLCRDISISAPQIKIEIDCYNPDICIYGHENSIRILFANILKNALEAMEFEGIIKISITSNKKLVNIKFTDNGPGIHPEDCSKLFNEFFTTKPTGSGLGLSICKKIAQEHNGFFTLSKAASGGCEAKVSIPNYRLN